MLTVHLQNQMVRLVSKNFYEAAFEGWSDEELSQLTFCTHFSNQSVGVTEIKRAWALIEATLHHEITDLMWSVGSQVDIHLCFEQLEDWRFLGSEEQVAWSRAIPSIRFPCVVHANYLAMLPLFSDAELVVRTLSIEIFTMFAVVEIIMNRWNIEPLSKKKRWNIELWRQHSELEMHCSLSI
jgi:hypothetical protein